MQKEKIRKRCSFLFLLLIALFTSCHNDNSEIEHENAEKAALRKELLELVNYYRTNGYDSGTTYYPPTTPVVWNETLETVAQLHSDDMLANQKMGHVGSDGSRLGDRLNRQGYLWRAYGENVSRGQESPESAIRGWLNSPGHCAIMMRSAYKEIGVARSKTGDYWTMVLTNPK